MLLGVSGSVAAYKSAELVRALRARGAEVRVVMSAAACELVGPATFQALSGRPVETAMSGGAGDGMRHIELARWCDAMVVAPASAGMLAKLAAGAGDDLMCATYLSCEAPVAAAPAMNRAMWAHPAVRANADTLRARGVAIWGPARGEQACGDDGLGRMLEPEEIAARAAALFAGGALAGARVLVTAGPTREALDPVRFLSNHSSGKMGFAMAAVARELGADTTLVAGPAALPTPRGVRRVDVVDAEAMRAAVFARLDEVDLLVAVAAVADYRPAAPAPGKMKKRPGDADEVVLRLARTPDILAEVARRPSPPFLVGFAAETEALEANAKAKLLAKNLDMIVANLVGRAAPHGFDADDNAVTVYWRGGERRFEPAAKTELARQLMRLVAARFAERSEHAAVGADQTA